VSRSARDSAQETTRRWQRRPYRYALALVLVCASLLALVLLSVDHAISAGDKLTQIGTGLAASIIFAVVYTVLANREYAELIRLEIRGQLDRHLTQVLHEVNELNQLFLPTDRYPATGDHDARFNQDLNRDLCESTFYFFRGTSAKYVPARLRACDHHLEVTQIVLLNPADHAAIDARARDRRRRPHYQGKSQTEIAREIRDEILVALVALFDCRDQCDIEIGFSSATSPVRIEVFDNAIYTSLYTSPESQRNTHPETARFSRTSQTYLIFREECRRQMQLAAHRRTFSAHEGDGELAAFMMALGTGDSGPGELARLRARYQELIGPFEGNPATTGVAI
jgi:hypothetical protein